jgi:hypothetical protein
LLLVVLGALMMQMMLAVVGALAVCLLDMLALPLALRIL